MDNYSHIFINRWGIDKDGYLTDIQSEKHCICKLYDVDDYSKDTVEIKLPTDIDGFHLRFPSGEIWLEYGYDHSLYGKIVFKYFGEKDSEEYKLFTSLVNEALSGNNSAAIELLKQLGKTFYSQKEIDEFDFNSITFDQTCYMISRLIHDEELNYKFIRLGAYKNNPYCQYYLSQDYEVGYNYLKQFGIEKNLNLAFQWYKKAAKNKNMQAMSRLSHLYWWGEKKCRRDMRKSFYWTKEAAIHGHIWDYERLAAWYESGIGCAKNYKKALFWFKKICKLPEDRRINCCSNYGAILYRLGYYYLYGLGDKKDLERSYDYFSKSAAEGYDLANDALIYFKENKIIENI